MGTFSVTYQDGKLVLCFSSNSIFIYFFILLSLPPSFVVFKALCCVLFEGWGGTKEGHHKYKILHLLHPTLLLRKQYGRPCYSENMQLVQFSASGCPKRRGLIVQHVQHLLHNFSNPAKRSLNSGLKYPHRTYYRKQVDTLTPLNITDMPVVM